MQGHRTVRTAFVLASVAGLLAGASGVAQTVGTVAVELRIRSDSVARHATLTSETSRRRTEVELAKLAVAKFGFLDWIPAHLAADPAGPRLVLELRDSVLGSDPPCKPRRVVGVLIVRPRGVEIEAPGEAEFSEVCNPFLKTKTEDEFVDDMRRLGSELLKGDFAERSLAFEVPLARRLDVDATLRRLYLPRAHLNLLKESKIEVRFGNDANQYLLVHPSTPEGDRTLVLVKDFRCSDITSRGPLPETFGECWHESLPDLLAACGEPFAYMKFYQPSVPVEASLTSTQRPPCGAIPDRPGISTTLTGDEP
jgi:hypothetical protein